MRIHFTCQCGKSLRAKPEMAGRGTICPACRSPVRIPAAAEGTIGREFASTGAQPAASGNSRSETSARRQDELVAVDRSRPALPPPARRLYQPKKRETSGQVVDPTRITVRSRPKWWKLISHPGDRPWSAGLSFDMPHVPVFLRLAGALTVFTVIALVAWIIPGPGTYEWRLPVLGLCGLGMLTCLGYVCSYLDAIVLVASQGKQYEPSIDGDPVPAVLSGVRWVGRFVVGPALLAGAAFGYWIYCGEVTVLDWVILAELAIAATGWWLVSLIVAAARPGTWIPGPQVVLLTASAMKWDTARLTLFATVVIVGHAAAGWFSIAWVHEHFVLGVVLMFVIWSSCLYFSAFAFRHLGLAFFRMEERRGVNEKAMHVSPPGKTEMPRCWVPAPQWSDLENPKAELENKR